MAELVLKLDPRQAVRASDQIERKIEGVGREADQTERKSNSAFRRMASAIRAAFSTAPVRAFFSAIQRGSQMAQNQMKKLLSILKNPLFLGVTGIGAVIGVKNSIDAAGDFRKLGTTFKVVSQDAAGDLAFLQQQADRLGLSLLDNAKAFGKFSAAGNISGLSAKTLKEIFLGVAEAGTIFGLSAEEQRGALKAMEQMLSKGNVQAEELRGQLGERLPGAFVLSAKAMGVTTKELNKMLDDGEVLAVDLLPKLAHELRNLAAPGLGEAVSTLQRETQRFENAFKLSQRDFGAPVSQALIPIVQDATARLEQRQGEGDFTRFGEFVAKGIEQAARAFAVLRGIMDPFIAVMKEIILLLGHAIQGVIDWAKAFFSVSLIHNLLLGLQRTVEAVSIVFVEIGKRIRENFEPAQFVALGAALGGLIVFLTTNQSLIFALTLAVQGLVIGVTAVATVVRALGAVAIAKFGAIAAAVYVFQDAVGLVTKFLRDLVNEVFNFGEQFGVFNEINLIIDNVSDSFRLVIETLTDLKVNGLSTMELIAAGIAAVGLAVLKLIRMMTDLGLAIAGTFRDRAFELHEFATNLRDLIGGFNGLVQAIKSAGSQMRDFAESFPHARLAKDILGVASGLKNAVTGTREATDAQGQLAAQTMETATVQATFNGLLEGSAVAADVGMTGVNNAMKPVEGTLDGLIDKLSAFIGSARTLKSAFTVNTDLAAAYFSGTNEDGSPAGIADTALARQAVGIKKLQTAIGKLNTESLKTPGELGGSKKSGGSGSGSSGGGAAKREIDIVEAQLRRLSDIFAENLRGSNIRDLLGAMDNAMSSGFQDIIETADEQFSALDMILQEFDKRLRNNSLNTADALVGGWKRAILELGTEAQQAADIGSQAFQTITGGIGDALGDFITGTKSASEAMTAMVSSILSDLARMLAQQAILQLFGGVFGGAAGVPFNAGINTVVAKRAHSGESGAGAGERVRTIRPEESIMTPSQLAQFAAKARNNQNLGVNSIMREVMPRRGSGSPRRAHSGEQGAMAPEGTVIRPARAAAPGRSQMNFEVNLAISGQGRGVTGTSNVKQGLGSGEQERSARAMEAYVDKKMRATMVEMASDPASPFYKAP